MLFSFNIFLKSPRYARPLMTSSKIYLHGNKLKLVLSASKCSEIAALRSASNTVFKSYIQIKISLNWRFLHQNALKSPRYARNIINFQRLYPHLKRLKLILSASSNSLKSPRYTRPIMRFSKAISRF